MFVSKENLHTSTDSQENISILIATPHPEDLNSLRQILHQRGWNLSLCTSASDATAKAAALRPAILICERDLPDGTWKDVLDGLQRSPEAPPLLVISRHADESLWAEVLNLGGYDVLLKPFDRLEVTRVIGMAWRHWAASQGNPFPASPSLPNLTPQFAA